MVIPSTAQSNMKPRKSPLNAVRSTRFRFQISLPVKTSWRPVWARRVGAGDAVMGKTKSPSPGAYVPEGRQAPEKASESGQSEAWEEARDSFGCPQVLKRDLGLLQRAQFRERLKL